MSGGGGGGGCVCMHYLWYTQREFATTQSTGQFPNPHVGSELNVWGGGGGGGGCVCMYYLWYTQREFASGCATEDVAMEGELFHEGIELFKQL